MKDVVVSAGLWSVAYLSTIVGIRLIRAGTRYFAYGIYSLTLAACSLMILFARVYEEIWR